MSCKESVQELQKYRVNVSRLEFVRFPGVRYPHGIQVLMTMKPILFNTGIHRAPGSSDAAIRKYGFNNIANEQASFHLLVFMFFAGF